MRVGYRRGRVEGREGGKPLRETLNESRCRMEGGRESAT